MERWVNAVTAYGIVFEILLDGEKGNHIGMSTPTTAVRQHSR